MAKYILDNLKTYTNDGGCVWSSGFKSELENGRYKLRQIGSVTEKYNSSSNENLSIINGFVKRDEDYSFFNEKYIYGISYDGRIWKFSENFTSGSLSNPNTYASGNETSYPDIWVDDDNDLYWTSKRYLGKFTTTGVNAVTFNGTGLNDATSGGTSTTNQVLTYVVEIDGTGSPNTFKWSDSGGTTWNATNVSITGSAQTLNNGVTITFGSTTGHTLGDKWTFTTGVWNNTFADFGSANSSTTARRQFVPYEDICFIGNKNYLAKINNDGTNFDAEYKQLPQKYEFRCGASNGNLVLIGGSKWNKGILLLWDTVSSGWNNKIYLDNNVDAIKPYLNGWIFVSGAAFYYTNGYTIQLLDYLPETSYLNKLRLFYNSIEVVNDKIVFGGAVNYITNIKSGFYVYDIKQKIFYMIPKHNQDYYSQNFGAIKYNIQSNIDVSYLITSYGYIGSSNGYAISNLNISSPNQTTTSYYISRKLSFPKKVKINQIRLKISNDKDFEYVYTDKTADILVAGSDGKNKFWSLGQANATLTESNKIQVDGTHDSINNADEGDMVLVLSGVNAGKSSFITSISNSGTNTETWTLEDDLTNNTENGTNLSVIPFRKFDKKTITNADEVVFYNNSKLDILDEFYLLIKVTSTHFPVNIDYAVIEYE